MSPDDFLRWHAEHQAAMAPHLAAHRRRQDEQRTRDREAERRELVRVAAGEPADWGHANPYDAHRRQYEVDWSDADAEAYRASWRLDEDEIARVCDTGFSVE